MRSSIGLSYAGYCKRTVSGSTVTFDDGVLLPGVVQADISITRDNVQKYADNKLMDGETQQRLYDPKGLSGNNVIYYCELTTTAGKTLYTCPQKFEDTPRSADQNTGENKVQATMIYDNMGRSISGTPKDGMYIIVEKLENGDVRVRKIAVYE